MTNNITHFYFDMDNVLTDLDGYLKYRFGAEHIDEQFYKEWKFILFEEPMFFENLPPSPYLKEVKALIEQLKNNNIIVSTLTSLGGMHHDLNLHSQKHKWIEKHDLDIEFLTVNKCFQKQYLAHPGAFLIDDMKSNIEQFKERGGNSLLYSFENHDECMDILRNIFLD